MKYLIVLGDGMADYPIQELGNKTPLAYAKTPNMDLLARSAEIGLASTVPEGMPPGSDVANLSVLGYDPAQYYTGRSPFEALSMGIDLGPLDIAFRCNLVTLSGENQLEKKSMIDYSSDEIPTDQSVLLIQSIAEQLNSSEFRFYPGISYRHLMVWHNGREELKLTPPHDIPNRVIGEYLPQGKGGDLLIQLMKSSLSILADHEVNHQRIAQGLRPANSLWFWGHGRKPTLPSFSSKYGLKGSVISAVDLTRGLGICAGLEVIKVPGATGNITTNFRGKAQAALEAVKRGQEFVYIHIEAPDEAGHRGELDNKVKAIEEIDEKVLGELLAGMQGQGEYKILLMPDHPTPLSIQTHTSEAVPYLIFNSSGDLQVGPGAYNEDTARQSGRYFPHGHLLMDHFLGDKG
ncbi:MAG: cofactor-independent phosphoglycerate mutase [Syntrophomonadaceae bacterium]|nr:cofactor-independent phosphoglycerate mutase [Syntrophomonadaceae bacterium]